MTEAAPATDTSPIRRPLRSHRAVLGTGPDAAVPAHYGAPTREQRRLESDRAVVDLGQAELLEVSGADARTWLTTITSQVLTGTAVGTGSWLTVLSPTGHVEHLARAVITAEDAVLLILDAGGRAGLRHYLEMMRFAARVEITDRDDLRVLGATAPSDQVLAGRLELTAPLAVHRDDWPQVAPGGVPYGPDPEDAVATVLSVHEATALEGLAWGEEHLAGMLAWEAVRIAAHRARAACEVDERTLPHELDLLRQAVHTAKGCYRGQETVAKVLNLGQPPRRLVMLHLDGSRDAALRPGGTVLMGGPQGRAVGRITSAALHVDLGPIALAVVKRAVPLEEPLTVQMPLGDGEDAEVLDLDAAQEPIVVPREHGERPRTARL